MLNQILETVLGEVKRTALLLCQAKGSQQAHASKLCVPTQEGLVRTFIATVQGWSADKDQGMWRACMPLIRPQMVFSCVSVAPLIWPQVVPWWTSLGYQTVTFSLKHLSFDGGFSSAVCYVKMLQLYPTLYDPTDCNPPDSSVPGLLQARILEWVAMSSFRGSKLEFLTQGSKLSLCASCIGKWVPHHWKHHLWSTQKSLKTLLHVSLGENQDSAPRLHYCFLTASPLSLHPFLSLISNCLNLPFPTQGRSGKLCVCSLQTKMGNTERLLCAEAPQGPAHFNSTFQFNSTLNSNSI